jgi:hypothetical protein
MVAAQDQAVFLVRVSVRQRFAGRTDIDVLVSHVAEVLLAEASLRHHRPEVIGLGSVTVMLALSQAKRNGPFNGRNVSAEYLENSRLRDVRHRGLDNKLSSPNHSITSSARASKLGGTVRPSAFAVLRLMTKSNLVGCSTGMSAGLVPRSTLSVKVAARRYKSGKFAP